jgi:uncharacterized protein
MEGVRLFFALMIVSAICGHVEAQGLQGVDYPIIDAHVHLNFSSQPEAKSGIPYTTDEFLRETQEAGVRGFVCHLPTEHATGPVLKGMTETFCAGVHDNPNMAAIEAGLKSGKFRCIKIYLGYAHHYAYDDLYRPLYPLAEKYGVPVVFHTGDTSSSNAKIKYTDPLTIDDVAVDFPHVTFVMAHLGNPWIESAAEVAYKNKNVYVDVSGIMIGDLTKTSDADLKRYLIDPVSWAFGYIDNADKMMFGTDWPLVNIKQYLDVVTKAIPPEHMKAFLHDNAAKIFKINL